MIFRSPVIKPLHESDWKRPEGNTDFRVTQEYGCTGFAAEPPLGGCAHFHRGIDLGNGKCGAAIVATAPGRVVAAGTRTMEGIHLVIDHGNGWWTGSCHLRARTVAAGATVAQGQTIGEVGDTGAAIGCHLHFSVKAGMTAGDAFWTDATGRWRDPWPLLEQNQPEDDMPPLAAYIPGHTATLAKGFNVRAAPNTQSDVLRTLSDPEMWVAFGWAKGEATSGSDEWLVRWAGRYEYIHRSGVTKVDPPDCTGQVKAATDPLNAQLQLVGTELSQAQGRISNAVAALTQ